MNDQPIRVMALHALAYCRRLFYIEEVEEIRIADAAVFAGRELHERLAEAEDGQPTTMDLGSESLGLVGRADCLKYADGRMIVYEHKRGRHKPVGKEAHAWDSDRLQVAAYTMMLEEHLAREVPEARVRYHATNRTVRVPVDAALRQEVLSAVRDARELRRTTDRPAITDNENLCVRCSLAPVCLPEEVRQARDPAFEPVRLFSPHHDRKTVHIVTQARAGRAGDTITVGEKSDKKAFPAREVRDIVLHGFAQITTQAIRLCCQHDIGVHWMTVSGRYIAGLTSGPGRVQQRLRQYEGLADASRRLDLVRRLASARAQSQLRYLLRATRGKPAVREAVAEPLRDIRHALARIARSDSPDRIRGHEGGAARAYFHGLKHLFSDSVPESLRYVRRSRRPPTDRFNALLSFGYGMLYQKTLSAILTVGLEPALGFYHTPRSAAHPLVLDLMELFRVPLWDMPLIGSINRGQWNERDDFRVTKAAVWLSDAGRRKAIDLLEQRMEQTWKHPVNGYSLSYDRLLELEVRLLEKEWSGEPGLFARVRLR